MILLMLKKVLHLAFFLSSYSSNLEELFKDQNLFNLGIITWVDTVLGNVNRYARKRKKW